MLKSQKIVDQDLITIAGQLQAYYKRFEDKTFLITGPNGLLASYLVDTIAYLNDHVIQKHPAKVLGLVRSEIKPTDRLGHLLNRTDIEFIQHDVSTPKTLSYKIDYIIHAAGRSAPATFESDPLGTIDVNVSGIRWLLEHAKQNPVDSFLYMSSGETYGNPTPENVPTPETYNGNVSTMSGRACYTESKRLSETLCNIYFKKFNVPVKITRPFIVFGPGMAITDKRVMAEFMKSGLEGRPIQMLNEGKDTRTYCYVSDATTLFFKILFSAYNGEAFNVANNNEELTIRQLAETVHDLCGIRVPVTVREGADQRHLTDAPSRVCPSLDRVKRLFDYNPEVSVKEGMKRTLEWNKFMMLNI